MASEGEEFERAWAMLDEPGRDDLTGSPNQFWSAPAAAFVPPPFLVSEDGIMFVLAPRAVPFVRAKALDRWRREFESTEDPLDRDVARVTYDGWEQKPSR